MHHEERGAPQARLAGNWRRYLRFWGARADADFDDELRFHVEMRIRDYVARGMTETEARAAVLRRLGDVPTIRDECVAITTRRERGMTRARVWDAFVHDLRYTLRSLGRQKGWTTVAVITLALGIGATTAVFSVVNNLILHPIPYPNADRIAIVFMEPTKGNETGMRVTITPQPRVVQQWVEGTHSFERLEAYRESDVTLERRGDGASTNNAAYILPTFIQFAGVQPILGRMFTAQEAKAKEPVVLLSEALWRTRFGADERVLGASVTINDKPHTIIGVLPGSLRMPRVSHDRADLWLPLEITNDAFGIEVTGLLKPGVTFAMAAAELDSLAARVESGSSGAARFQTTLAGPGEMVPFRDSLILLSWAVGLVLLIACTNVAHLLLARSATRQRELAIRAALGAGKGRLVRQLLTESLLLSAAGCAAGIAVGWSGLRALVAMRPEHLTSLTEARIDSTSMLAAIALSVVTGIGFGIFAAIQAARRSSQEALKSGAPSASHARQQNRLRSLLVVSEMALSATLLVGATLLIRSVMHLQSTDPGFDTRGLYALKPTLPATRYANDAAKKAVYDELAQRVRTIPGVQAVSLANGAPPGYNFLIGAMQFEGEAPPPTGTTSFLKYNAVLPDYFRTLGIRFVEGTTFSDSTRNGLQMIVNQGFAKKHWPRGSAVGRRVRIIGYDGKGEWNTVVGVVADASIGGLTDVRSDPIMYLPQPDYYAPDLVVRAAPGVDILPALRSAVTSVDRRLPPPTVTNVERALSESVAQPRFTMMLLVSFTVLALVLAAVGLYGVMAYSVAQRTREIGIRIALGATRRRIARSIITNGLTLALAGSAIGLAGAWFATKVVERMLYGVSRTDPMSFVLGGLVLVATAMLACLVPMNRAASVDPIIAIKAD